MNEINQEKPVEMNKCVRTYSRRRGEDTQIEGVEKLCRLCLSECDSSIPIFVDKGDGGDVCAALAFRIMMCVGFEVSNIECFPNKICIECNNELDKIYMFRKKCELSYQRLKSHLAAINKMKAKEKQELTTTERNEMEKNSEEGEKNGFNMIFVVGSDGTIKFEQNGEKDTVCLIENSEQNQSSNIKIDNQNSLLIPSQDNSKEKEEIQAMDMEDVKNITKELIIDIPKVEDIKFKTESNPILSILQSLLLKAGVLVSHDDAVSVCDAQVELKTRDGAVVCVDFTEESDDEDQKAIPLEFNINNNESDKVPAVQHVNPKQKQLDFKGGNPGKWWCNECGRCLANRSALARHSLAIHARLRPHQCSHCDRTFAQKAVLLRHELVHQEKRPFPCTECSKSFTQRGALEQHARSHRKTLALHHCAVCKKVFLYASGLSRHMITHNSPGFSCGGCSRQFNDKSSLRRHMKNTNHPPDPNS